MGARWVNRRAMGEGAVGVAIWARGGRRRDGRRRDGRRGGGRSDVGVAIWARDGRRCGGRTAWWAKVWWA